MNIDLTHISANEGRGPGCHGADHEQVVPYHDICALNSAGGFLRSNFSSPRRNSNSGLWKLPETSAGTPPWMKSLKKIRDEGGKKSVKDKAIVIDKEDKREQVKAKKRLVAPLVFGYEIVADDTPDDPSRNEPQSTQREKHQTSATRPKTRSRSSEDSSKKKRRERQKRREEENEAPVVALKSDPVSLGLHEKPKQFKVDSLNCESGKKDMLLSPMVQSGQELLQAMPIPESFAIERVSSSTQAEKADPPGILVDDVVTAKAPEHTNPTAITKKKVKRDSQRSRDQPNSFITRNGKEGAESPRKKRSGNKSSKSQLRSASDNPKKPRRSSVSSLKGEVVEWFRTSPDVRKGSRKSEDSLPTVSNLVPKPQDPARPMKNLPVSRSNGEVDTSPCSKDSDVTSITSNTTRSGEVFEAPQKPKSEASARSGSPRRSTSAVSSSAVSLARKKDISSTRRRKSDGSGLSKSSDENGKVSKPRGELPVGAVPKATSKGPPSHRMTRSGLPSSSSSKSSRREKTNHTDSSKLVRSYREEPCSVTWTRESPRRLSKSKLEMIISPNKKTNKKSTMGTSWEEFRERKGVKVVALLTVDGDSDSDEDLKRSGFASGMKNWSSSTSPNLLPLDISEFDAEDFSTIHYDDPTTLVPAKTDPAPTKSLIKHNSADESIFPMTSTDDDAFWSPYFS
jgi:hypothetical protein